ncbi:23S rRNA (adenine(2503)-C(2))-methyltransferase RlmN [Candidatus Dojkabacteria bacterium]|nr:23S rRNA (adenine(2503)-C(2))-methyltransferase RlmN [Candidatus Dojkabacteria bacterium]
MIEEFADKNNIPKFRIKQFNNLYYKELINSFDELFTWPKDLRKKLKEKIEFSTIKADKKIMSKDRATQKVLFRRKSDNHKFESVLMLHDDDRNTVCVSCMVGCPVGCKFCATGQMGFKAKLSAKEIIDQILYFQRHLNTQNQKITNIVFMGMGEPLLNLNEVQKSIAVITDPDKLAMSTRRITISTVGIIPGIRKLIKSDFKGRLAISLHAPTQTLREVLIPIANQYKLKDLMRVLSNYTHKTNKRVSYEYVLIRNINDSEQNAKQLAELLHNRLAHVNLIPYNPIKEDTFSTPAKNTIYNFAKILEDKGITYTIRVTMGEDVNAACGQLSNQ